MDDKSKPEQERYRELMIERIRQIKTKDPSIKCIACLAARAASEVDKLLDIKMTTEEFMEGLFGYKYTKEDIVMIDLIKEMQAEGKQSADDVRSH